MILSQLLETLAGTNVSMLVREPGSGDARKGHHYPSLLPSLRWEAPCVCGERHGRGTSQPRPSSHRFHSDYRTAGLYPRSGGIVGGALRFDTRTRDPVPAPKFTHDLTGIMKASEKDSR